MSQRDGQSVDAAFNRVLSAERDAREAVAACRSEADARLAEAEQTVRGIIDRSEARIRTAHAIADRGIERALSELRAPLGSNRARVDEPFAEEIGTIVATLARELTEPPG